MKKLLLTIGFIIGSLFAVDALQAQNRFVIRPGRHHNTVIKVVPRQRVRHFHRHMRWHRAQRARRAVIIVNRRLRGSRSRCVPRRFIRRIR